MAKHRNPVIPIHCTCMHTRHFARHGSALWQCRVQREQSSPRDKNFHLRTEHLRALLHRRPSRPPPAPGTAGPARTQTDATHTTCRSGSGTVRSGRVSFALRCRIALDLGAVVLRELSLELLRIRDCREELLARSGVDVRHGASRQHDGVELV